jgi:glycosyltransferase involved in cell wall biosynthesis
MKILLISSNSSSKGGGERYLVYLTRGFLKMNYEVTIIISSISFMDTWSEMLIKEGAKVLRVNLIPLVNRRLRFLSSIFDFKQIKKIQLMCSEVCPDLLIVNQQYDEDGLDYIKGALKYSISNVISIMHMPMTANKNKRPLGYIRGVILRDWYKRNKFKIIFVSEGSKKEFVDYYKLPGKYYVVNNGFPIISLAASTKKRLFNNSYPTLSFIGQLNTQKNLSLLIQSWIILNSSGFNCNLLIIGDGPNKSDILDQLNNSNLKNNFLLLDWTNTPEKYYNYIDVFVMTSLFEGLPLTLIEIAGQGIPCVVTPFNGAIDVSRHAYWVKISKNYFSDEISNLIKEALLIKLPNNVDIEKFKNYFSIARACNEIIQIFKK